MRARKRLLRSCSLLKETIFRRGLDADRGIGDIVHRYLASRRRVVYLLITESVFQGWSALFLKGHSLDTLVAQRVGTRRPNGAGWLNMAAPHPPVERD